jgi:hypothetical protein
VLPTLLKIFLPLRKKFVPIHKNNIVSLVLSWDQLISANSDSKSAKSQAHLLVEEVAALGELPMIIHDKEVARLW